MGASAKPGQGKAFKNKWVSKKGANLVRLVDSIVDQTQNELKEIESTGTLGDAKVLADLKKRTLVDKQYDSLFKYVLPWRAEIELLYFFVFCRKSTSYSIKKGTDFALEVKKEATDITADMLQS